MITERLASGGPRKNNARKIISSAVSELRANNLLYIMVLPGIILMLLFSYIPMFGIIVAFKDFKYDKGILGSPWVSPIFKNFEYFFTSDYAWRVTRNTILLNFAFIIIGTIVTVAIALMINELSNKFYKRLSQTVVFLPNFVSWIVVGIFAYNIFSTDYGIINALLSSLGFAKVDFYAEPAYWPAILIMFSIWRNTGLGTVIYLAVLTSIDSSYYEAAQIDGATRWQQAKLISLPMLVPTMIILTILAVGKIMNSDFGMFYALIGDNSRVFSTADVIDTFVFRNLRLNGDIPMSSATGFYQSVISFMLVLAANMLANRYQPGSGIF